MAELEMFLTFFSVC